jgi:hypothetical protein
MNTVRQLYSATSQALLLGAAAAAASAPALAQPAAPSMQTIEVTAPRAELRTVCRSVDQQLQDLLGAVAWREAVAGTIDVHFQIDGARITEVRTTGGPLAYRMATNRAVRSIDCHNGAQGRQSVQMQVVFLDPETDAQRERVALRTETQIASR